MKLDEDHGATRLAVIEAPTVGQGALSSGQLRTCVIAHDVTLPFCLTWSQIAKLDARDRFSSVLHGHQQHYAYERL